ncbi:MAG: hypothetical protein RLZZ387_1749 [Chloroflexota bacterium]|jgi:hypothetical protein
MLSIALSLCGIYSLLTGKISSVLYGGRGYRVESSAARAAGAALALAFPLSALLARVLPLLLGQDALIFGSAVEIAVFLLTLGTALAVCRAQRRPNAV